MRERFYNCFLKCAGICFLILSKGKYYLKGYSTPKVIGKNNYQERIGYDLNVVDKWLDYLSRYSDMTVEGKNILELGPGSDLGTGLYLLSKGAARYSAVDVNDLVKNSSQDFYHLLIDFIVERFNGDSGRVLRKDLLRYMKDGSKLNFIHDRQFDLKRLFKKDTIDLVFGQAVFEHFEDIHKTAADLSYIVKKSGILITEIDLRTHSRWIRDKDPNNIYRYSRGFYSIFHFPGAPNRQRPSGYRRVFEDKGWANIEIIPLESVEGNYWDRTKNYYNTQFKGEDNQMDLSSVMFCATKK